MSMIPSTNFVIIHIINVLNESPCQLFGDCPFLLDDY